MNSKGTAGFVYALVGAASLASATGCSETAARSRPVAPTVAFGAMASDVPTLCSPEGMPRVLARHVVPRAGVAAASDGTTRVWLRFATTEAPRVVAEIDATSLERVDGCDILDDAFDDDASPAEIGLPDGRRFVAWTDGSVEQGMRVRAATIGTDGGPVGNTVDIGYEGSAIGRPVVAVGANGHGVLAFIESNDAGFQVVAVRVTCASE